MYVLAYLVICLYAKLCLGASFSKHVRFWEMSLSSLCKKSLSPCFTNALNKVEPDGALSGEMSGHIKCTVKSSGYIPVLILV